jgi:hypothetical protein
MTGTRHKWTLIALLLAGGKRRVNDSCGEEPFWTCKNPYLYESNFSHFALIGNFKGAVLLHVPDWNGFLCNYLIG